MVLLLFTENKEWIQYNNACNKWIATKLVEKKDREHSAGQFSCNSSCMTISGFYIIVLFFIG